MILFVKHIDIEGPGTMGGFFENTIWDTEILELNNKRKVFFPKDLSGLEAVVVLGGPMNVYEEGRFPFLKEENKFIKELLRQQIPFLGICLGAQLLAKACGAKVNRAGEPEVGWYKANLTESGIKDPLFDGVDNRLDVFQWHEDEAGLPDGGVLLATSDVCENQAFRFGDSAYGLQFHIEVDDTMIRNWANEYTRDNEPESQAKTEQMLSDYHKRKEAFNRNSQRLLLNFSRLFRARRLEA